MDLNHVQDKGAGENKKERWAKAILKTTLWFVLGFFLTAYISKILPAQPIIVRTASIDTGVYWLDLKSRSFARGDFITFDFKPSTQELQERFTPIRHTKMLRGLPGDVVYANANGELSVCWGAVRSESTCHTAGVPRKFDTQGRPLTPWLKPNKTYTLNSNEYWVYGPNEKSLDSRYNGPVSRELIIGKAFPIYIWKRYFE